jgi:phosphatidate cytidylyltransferase
VSKICQKLTFFNL